MKAEATLDIDLIKLPPNIIGEIITNLNVKNLSSTSKEIEEIRNAIYLNKLIVIRDQDLTPSQYVDFSKKLGTPQIYFQKNYHHSEFPEIFVSSNVNEGGEKVGVAGSGHYWHTDCQFQQHPLPFTCIYPIIIPKTLRETRFIDMHHVYNNLPKHLKDFVEEATLIHGGNNRYKVKPEDIDKSIQQLIDKMNEMVPFVKHPAVIKHPVTGEKILYASRGFTMNFEGLSYEANKKILNELFDFIEKEEHVHTHSWKKNDLIIWDNRSLLHMASPLIPGEKSKSHRIGVYDNQPFYAGL